MLWEGGADVLQLPRSLSRRLLLSHLLVAILVAAFGAGRRALLTFGTWAFGWEAWQCQLELLSSEWRTVAMISGAVARHRRSPTRSR
jgi:hypothetical protein